MQNLVKNNILLCFQLDHQILSIYFLMAILAIFNAVALVETRNYL